jgi:hypothetical protein
MTVLIRAEEAEVLSASGVTLLADVPDTSGHLTSHRSIFQPGKEGAPPHLHREAAELFFVLKGSLRVLTGDNLDVLNTHAKPRFGYYRLLEGAYRGETSWTEVAETSDLYDNHYVESPAWQARQS